MAKPTKLFQTFVHPRKTIHTAVHARDIDYRGPCQEIERKEKGEKVNGLRNRERERGRHRVCEKLERYEEDGDGGEGC